MGFIKKHTLPLLSCCLAVVLYVVLVFLYKIYSFKNAHFSAYDLGLHLQAMSNILHGNELFNSIRGMKILGDHLWFVNYLVAPFFALYPRVESLFVLQALAHALPALILYVYACHKKVHPWVSLSVSFGWLLQPALWNMNLESYHPETLGIPLLFLVFIFAEEQRWRLAWLFFGLSLLCKEDISLTLFAVGAWVAVFRHKKHGSAMMLVSLLYFAACLKIFLPAFNERGFFRTEPGYWFSRWSTHKFELSYYWNVFTSEQAATYFARLLAPTLFGCLLAPEILLLAVPSFAINCLSGNRYLMSVDFHYNNQTLPFIWLALILALSRTPFLNGKPWDKRSKIFCFVFLSAGLSLNVAYSQVPLDRIYSKIKQKASSSSLEKAQAFAGIAAKLANPDLIVSADYDLVPLFALRPQVFMFPNPFFATLWGIHNQYPTPPPPMPDYIVLDSSREHDKKRERALIEALNKSDAVEIEKFGSIKVYKVLNKEKLKQLRLL